MDAPLPTNLNEAWEQFFLSEDSRKPNHDSYDDIFDDGTLFPLQRKRELEKMVHAARLKDPKIVAEIGADKGGGLYHWCKSLESSVKKVIACEIRGTPYKKLFEKAFPEIDFLWLPQSSYSEATVNIVYDWLGEDKIDTLFIDGDKSLFATDFYTYRPMMRERGIVFMHDIQDQAPGGAYKKVLLDNNYDICTIIDKSESEESVIRKNQGEEATSAHERWLRIWEGRSCGVGVINL